MQLGFAWYPNVSGPITANSAIALAVAGDNRLAIPPATPTSAEAGLPKYKFDGWFGLGAPAGVPQSILHKLNAALNDALMGPAVRAGYEKIGAVPVGLSFDQAKAFHANEIVREIISSRYRQGRLTRAKPDSQVKNPASSDCSGRSPGASRGETAQDGIGKVGETALCLSADTLGRNETALGKNSTRVRQWAFEINQLRRDCRFLPPASRLARQEDTNDTKQRRGDIRPIQHIIRLSKKYS